MPVSTAFIMVIIVWSTTPLAVKWSSMGMDPASGAFFRMVIAAVLGTVLVKIMGMRLRWDRAAVRGYVAANVGIFGAMSLIYWAATKIPSGLISVMFGLAPMLSGVVAQRLLGEAALSMARWLGVLVALSGLAVIFWQETQIGWDGAFGIILVFSATVLYVMSGVWVKKLAVDIHPFPHTVASIWLSVPLYGVTCWLTGQPEQWVLNAKVIGTVVYLGVFGSLVGFVCFFYVLNHMAVTSVNMIPLITPVMALMLGSLLAGEQLRPVAWFGVGLSLLGLLGYVFGDSLQRWMMRQLRLLVRV